MPVELVTITSSGAVAAALGTTVWLFPLEIVMVELEPVGITLKLKTALPAVDEAITVTGPFCVEALKSTLARPSAAVVAVTVVAVVAPLVRVPAPEVRTLNEILTPGTALPRLFTAKTSRDLLLVVPCSTDWLLPLVTMSNEPFDVFTPEFATFKLKTTVPETEEANTAIFPVVDDAVKLVLALPLAPVVAVAVESVPPLAVVTVKETATPATGVPLALVAITSSGNAAAALGFML